MSSRRVVSSYFGHVLPRIFNIFCNVRVNGPFLRNHKGVIGLQECVVLLSGAHLRNAARADKMNTRGLVRVGNQGPGRYVYK